MNILFLITNLNIGGAEKYVVGLSNTLIKHGHNVTVCTLSDGGVLRGNLNERVSYYELGEKPNLSLKKVIKLNKIIENKSIQVVHSHLFKADLLNYLSSLFINNTVRISTEHSTSSRRKKYKFFGEIQKVMYKNFDVITVISDAVRNHILEWTGINKEKLITIYNGTDMVIRPVNEIIQKINECRQRKFVIGTLARLESRKDIQTSLKAISFLVYKLKMTDFEYRVYGDGPEREKLELISKELKIDKYVHFLGFRSDIENVIDGIDVHILSSTEEGFGISIIETMARGIPNIGTRTGGIPEVISDNIDGFLVECRDYEDLANKVYLLLSENERMLEFGLSAKQSVENNFTLDCTVFKLLEVYKEIFKDKRNL